MDIFLHLWCCKLYRHKGNKFSIWHFAIWHFWYQALI